MYKRMYQSFFPLIRRSHGVVLIILIIWIVACAGMVDAEVVNVRVDVLPKVAEVGEPIVVKVFASDLGHANRVIIRDVHVRATIGELTVSPAAMRGVAIPDTSYQLGTPLGTEPLAIWSGEINPSWWPQPSATIDRVGTGLIQAEVTYHYEEGSSSGETTERVEASFTVVRETAASVERRVQRLRECVSSSDDPCLDVAPYFTAVRDEGAATLLVELLRKHPVADFLVYSIVNQKRAKDATTLRDIAADPRANRSLLLEQAEVLESRVEK